MSGCASLHPTYDGYEGHTVGWVEPQAQPNTTRIKCRN